jgi:hypothetical protein
VFNEFGKFCFEHRSRILWTGTIALLLWLLLPWHLSLTSLATWYFDIPGPDELRLPLFEFLVGAIAVAFFFTPLVLMNWARQIENRTTKLTSLPRSAVLTVWFGPLFVYFVFIQLGLMIDFSQRIFGWRLAGLASSMLVSPKLLDSFLRGNLGDILLLSGGALVGVVLAWWDRRSQQPARAAFFAVAIVALRCSALLLVQDLGVYSAINHFSGAESFSFGAKDAAYSLEFFVLWSTAISVVFIPQPSPSSNIRRLEWEGKGYVASAGSAALAVLALAVFGLTQAAHSGIRLHRLIGLRNAMAHDVAAERLLRNQEFQQWFASNPNASVQEKYTWTLQHDLKKGGYSAPDWCLPVVKPDRSGFEEEGRMLDVELYEEPTGQNGLGSRSYPLAWRGNVFMDLLIVQPDKHDWEVFRYIDRIGAERKVGEDFWGAYRRVEQQIEGENVALPGTVFTFQIEEVVWITGGAVLALLIITRDRVYRTLQSRDLGLNEPWLLLDAHEGMASLLRTGYLGALVALPTFLMVSITRVAALQLEASKGTSTPGQELAVFVVTELMAGGVLYSSLTTMNLILRLRKARIWAGRPSPSV